MLYFIERYDIVGTLQIQDDTLLGWSICAFRGQPPSRETPYCKWRQGTNIVYPAFDRQRARLGLPSYPGLCCAVVEQLLSEAAAVVIAGAEEQNCFHDFVYQGWLSAQFRLRPLTLWAIQHITVKRQRILISDSHDRHISDLTRACGVNDPVPGPIAVHVFRLESSWDQRRNAGAPGKRVRVGASVPLA